MDTTAQRVWKSWPTGATCPAHQSNPTSASTISTWTGAVVLRAGTADEPGALTTFDLGSDGTRAELIRQAAGGSRQRSTQQDPPEAVRYLAMNGTAVFTTAVTTMAASSRAVLERGGYSADDVNRLVARRRRSTPWGHWPPTSHPPTTTSPPPSARRSSLQPEPRCSATSPPRNTSACPTATT